MEWQSMILSRYAKLIFVTFLDSAHTRNASLSFTINALLRASPPKLLMFSFPPRQEHRLNEEMFLIGQLFYFVALLIHALP
jgi:hypothetical protein